MRSIGVSTEDQSKFGHSLDEQEDKLKKLCEFKDYEIYKVYREEGVSAKDTNRPKFQEMIEDMKLGKINKIIVYKLDRLTRSIKDLEMICTLFEEYNCSLESVAEEINTDTANGKFFIRMLTILVQLEIERTSERTKFGLVGAAKKGYLSGRVPLGFTKNEKQLVVDDITADVIRRIFRLYLDGLSVCSICKLFNQEEVLNRKWVTTTDTKATYEIKNNSTLSIGENKISIEVIAEDGTTKTYNLNINREMVLSSETGINVAINGEEVKFDNYKSTVYVSSSSQTITFDYTLKDKNAKAEMNELSELKSGDNIINIKVIAEDGTEQQYEITIHKYTQVEDTISNIIVFGIFGGIGYGIYYIIKKLNKKKVK